MSVEREAVWPFHRNAVWTAVLFAVGVFVFETAAFREAYYSIANGVGYPTIWLNARSLKWQLLHAGLIAGSLATFAAFVYGALIASTPWKIAHVVVFTVACLIEYSTEAALGRATDASDVRQFLLVNDAATLLQGAGLFMAGSALMPVSALSGLLLRFRGEQRRHSAWRFAGVMAAVAGLYAAAANVPEWVVLYRDYMKYPVPAFNAPFRTIADFTRESADAWDTVREPVPAIEAPAPTDTIVFVVDESVRGDHLSLNGYRRDTTPYLVALERGGSLQNWGLASALATCSHTAHAMLLTGMGLDDLPATWSQARRAPTIFQYAKAAGYRTHYLDASMKVRWSLGPNDAPYVDDWRGAGSFAAPPDTDVAVARAVQEIVQGPPGQFIWVTKVGVHFNYDQRFPRDAAEWRPYTTGGVTSGGVVAMENAYDDALKYNLEHFFRTLLPEGAVPTHVRVLYTSDHAESIVPDISRQAPHCGVAREQAVVPLFLVGHDRRLDTRYPASHANVFATLLDLLGVPGDRRRRPYGQSLLSATAADAAPRFFAGPFLHSTTRLPFD